jgi:hypothetical protein
MKFFELKYRVEDSFSWVLLLNIYTIRNRLFVGDIYF